MGSVIRLLSSYLLVGIPVLQVDMVHLSLTEIRSVIKDYRVALACSGNDYPWEILHYLLAYGEEAEVMTPAGPVKCITYLCQDTRLPSGKPLFAKLADALIPATDHPPAQHGQDHRNQILAGIAQTATVSGERMRPLYGALDDRRWSSILRGAWADYRTDEDPSWTLICYVRYVDVLPNQDGEVDDRIVDILRTLISPKESTPLSCEGAHALHAMAICLNSPSISRVSAQLKREVKGYLDKALTRFRDNSKNGPFYVHSKERPSSRARLTAYEQAEWLIATDGHALEWIVEYLSASELRAPEVTALVKRLCGALQRIEGFEIRHRGGVCHAIHGLRTYLEKVQEGALQTMSSQTKQ